MSKPKPKPRKKKPIKAGPSNQLAVPSEDKPTIAPQVPKGKKRKGDSIEARPKKSRIVSVEFIDDTDDDETQPKLMSKSPPQVEPPPKPKSQPMVVVEIPAKPQAQSRPRVDTETETEPKPKSKSRRRVGEEKPIQRLIDPILSAERLQKQNAAIDQGKYRLATTPCETCTRRLDRYIVPCAVVTSRKEAACFTCKLGKTSCDFSGKKIKEETDGEEVKIVRKKVKKPKQDVKMGEVTEVDLETTEVGQSKGKGKQDVEMSEGGKGEVDVEMNEVARGDTELGHGETEVTHEETEVGITPDKGKGRATPAITIEPPTPTPVKVTRVTEDMDVDMTYAKGKDHRHGHIHSTN